MAALNYSNSVLPVLPATALATSGGDISVSNGKLAITGCPIMKWSGINTVSSGSGPSSTISAGSLYPNYLVAKSQVRTATPTSANNAEFGIVIKQYVPSLGTIVEEVLMHTTPSSGNSATTICNAWRTQLALSNLEITGSGTDTLILTADAGSELFTATSINSATSIVETTTAVNIVSSTDATPIVVTTDASTFAVGDTVTIANHETNTNANGVWRVSATNGTTTVTLQGSVATGGGAGGATGTCTDVAQYSKGAYADLIAAGIDSDLISAGSYYNQITFNYSSIDPALTAGNQNWTSNEHTQYVKSDATNFADFNSRMQQMLMAYTSTSGTTFNVETVSLA